MRIFHDPERLGFLVLAITFAIVRLVYTLRSRGVPARISVVSLADRVLLAFIIPFGTVVIPFTWVFTDFLDFADYSRPSIFGALGGFTIGIGVLLFWRTHSELGRAYNGYLRVNEGTTLITTGLYSRVRHPMYGAMMIYAAGQILLIPNWLAGPSNAIVLVFIYFIRIPKEEALLLATFGEEYERYRTRTGAIVPRIRQPRD